MKKEIEESVLPREIVAGLYCKNNYSINDDGIIH